MDMLYRILSDRCSEIEAEGENSEMIEKVYRALDIALDYANVARREGLLDLEEKSENLDISNQAEAIFRYMILLVVDGTDPKMLIDMGINRLISARLKSYEGLIALIYVRTAIMIQCGNTPRVVEMMLESLLPPFIKKSFSTNF